MPQSNEIRSKVKTILEEEFNIVEIKYIPRLDDTKLTFGNTGLKFTSTVVFIDMRGSTKTLNNHNKVTVAKIHMSYFHTIVKIANANNGHVRSFNGDSALIFFEGTTKDALSNAVITAMKIKYMLSDIENGINRLLKKYSEVNYGVGLDYGEVLCTKVGVGGDHNRDLFWIGNSVNKSTIIGNEHSSPTHIGISNIVYNNLNDRVKYTIHRNYYGQDEKVNMWTKGQFTYNGKQEYYYYTNYHFVVP